MSRKTLAVMQLFPGPRYLAKPRLRFLAQLPQPGPGATCAGVMCGEPCKVVADQSVDGGVTFGGAAPNCGQHIFVYAQVIFFMHTGYV